MHKFLEFVRQQDQEQQEHNALLARKGGGGSIEQYHLIIRPAEKQHLIADLAHVKCVADTNGGLVSLFANEATMTCSDAMAVTFHTSSQIKHGLFLGKDVFCF